MSSLQRFILFNICVKSFHNKNMKENMNSSVVTKKNVFKVTMIFDLWPPNSSQLILESKWTSMPNVSIIPLSCSWVIIFIKMGETTKKHNASDHSPQQHWGIKAGTQLEKKIDPKGLDQNTLQHYQCFEMIPDKVSAQSCLTSSVSD